MERSNIQISVSFGKKETELLKYLDHFCERDSMSRSGWIKQKIREEGRIGAYVRPLPIEQFKMS